MELIRGLPLSLRDTADRKVWHFEQHRKLTVRSTYHVARGLNVANGEGVASFSSSSSFIGEKLWKKLWNACVPGKVKICVWRACLNSLPT